MRGNILILLFLGTAAATSQYGSKISLRTLERNHPLKAPSSGSSQTFLEAATSTSENGRKSRILERNTLIFSHPAYRRYHLRGSNGFVLAYFFPRSFGIKNKSGRQEERRVTTPTCWFKTFFKCPRDARF